MRVSRTDRVANLAPSESDRRPLQSIYWEMLLALALILLSGVLAMADPVFGAARTQSRDWSSRDYRAADLALGQRGEAHVLRPLTRILPPPARALASAAAFVVGLLKTVAAGLLRLVGIRRRSETPVTQEEISDLLQKGTKAGVFEEGEHEMIERVFRFSDRRARVLMTPRNDIVWIDQADPPDEIRRKVLASPHTRFPVCDESLDNVLGIVEVKDLLMQSQDAEPFRIKGRLTMPLFLYEGTRGLKILEMFKKSGHVSRWFSTNMGPSRVCSR